MRIQAHTLRLPCDTPELDSSSRHASSILYLPESYQFSNPIFYNSVEPAHYVQQNVESSDSRATGIFHDFNNLLAIILSHSSIALAKLNADHPAHSYVERVVRATKRAADLSSQLMVNTSHQQAELPPINLNLVVQDMIELLEPKLAQKAKVKLNLKIELHPILANISQIQQVVMNLLLNAAEAIEKTPGSITVETGHLVIPESHHFLGARGLTAEHYIFLQVIDNGIGMDQDTLDRIFEPHFTTKPTGSGIGLTATLNIVHAHNGAVRVLSTPNYGTKFQIFLPACLNELYPFAPEE